MKPRSVSITPENNAGGVATSPQWPKYLAPMTAQGKNHKKGGTPLNKTSDWGHSLAPARAAVPAPAAGSSRSRSHPAQHFGDLLVVRCQAFDLLLQILGQRFGPPELRL